MTANTVTCTLTRRQRRLAAALVLGLVCLVSAPAYSQNADNDVYQGIPPITDTTAPVRSMAPAQKAPSSMIYGGVEQRAPLDSYGNGSGPAQMQQLGALQPQFAPPVPPPLPIQGSVQQNALMPPPSGMQMPQSGMMPNNPFMPAWLPAYAKALSAYLPQQQLQGEVETKVERPSYLPGYAYSDPSMVSEYHNMDTIWMDKRPIPPKEQMMKLAPSVIRYWRGYKEEPFWVKTVPDPQHPGNFTFSSPYSGGPKGWLQYLDQPGRFGFPQYRYWFDPS